MAREISRGNLLYKVQFGIRDYKYVECSGETDLFEYLADCYDNGYIVLGVTEIRFDGSTPRVAVKSNQEYKRIMKEHEIRSMKQ